ncbi:MAG: hypothetical protein ABIJ08_00920 [Nanoarchaeota archaeon]
MKITIDTKEDTHSDIKNVIRMLQHLVGENPASNKPNIFEDPTSFGQQPDQQQSSADSLFSMFDDASSEQAQITEPETKEQEEDIPELIPY